jgi:hypothetical protein
LNGHFLCFISIMPSWRHLFLWHFSHYKRWK